MRLIYQWTSSLLLFIPIVLFSSCQTTKKNISDKKAVSKSLPDNPFASPQQLTFIGENEKPTLSIDSQFLYYISYNHRRHSHRQIYRMELGSRLNKRITFHDGDNYDIVLDPLQSLMYYSSTTDEIKEDSTYIKNALKKMLPPSAKSEKTPSEEDHLPSFPVTEIYRSQINGSHIERLTQSRKFDGHLTIHPLTGAKYFSSERAGHPQIFRMGKREKKFFPFHTSPLAQLYPQFSPDGKHLAYVEWDSKC
ncbi:MAG: hypothetical protein KDD61_03555, partial [Bdellovibrionales bacterium]|nr:hypothetical protein [Bdellovibrionales bacterium]